MNSYLLNFQSSKFGYVREPDLTSRSEVVRPYRMSSRWCRGASGMSENTDSYWVLHSEFGTYSPQLSE